jgi:hypothetical protein
MLGDDCEDILGGKRVIDHQRLDMASGLYVCRNPGLFFTREDLEPDLWEIFEETNGKIMSGDFPIIDIAVKYWAKRDDSNKQQIRGFAYQGRGG